MALATTQLTWRCRYVAASEQAEHLLLISWLVTRLGHRCWLKAFSSQGEKKKKQKYKFSRPPIVSRLPLSSVGAHHLDKRSPLWTLPFQTGSSDIAVYHSKESKVQIPPHFYTLRLWAAFIASYYQFIKIGININKYIYKKNTTSTFQRLGV